MSSSRHKDEDDLKEHHSAPNPVGHSSVGFGVTPYPQQYTSDHPTLPFLSETGDDSQSSTLPVNHPPNLRLSQDVRMHLLDSMSASEGLMIVFNHCILILAHTILVFHFGF